MFEDDTKQHQWRAHAASLEIDGIGLESIIDAVWAPVAPSCERLTAGPADPEYPFPLFDCRTRSATAEVPIDAVGAHDPRGGFADVALEQVAPRHQGKIPRSLDQGIAAAF